MTIKSKVSGGNGDVYFDDTLGVATKILRNTSTKEKIQRFKQEQETMQLLSKENIHGIVEIIDVEIDDSIKECKIIMKKYDGNLWDIVNVTKGDVKLTFNLILPIVKALHSLTKLDEAIYHRDIKPDNILYSTVKDNYQLSLTDFGICFIENDEVRLTPSEIGIGARLFLAPEYEVGRVEKITDKGDIFSIGKVIWCMINGVNKEYLPSNYWFVEDYNLQNKFPENPNIIFANYMISLCLNFDPSKRCTYEDLISNIEQFLHSTIIDIDYKRKLEIELFQQKRDIRSFEVNSKNKLLVNRFGILYTNALDKISNNYKALKLIDVLKGYKFKDINRTEYTTTNVDRNSAHYIYSDTYETIYIAINYNPARSDKLYANISFEYRVSTNNISNSSTIEFDDTGKIMIRFNDVYDELSEEILIDFLEQLITDYIT